MNALLVQADLSGAALPSLLLFLPPCESLEHPIVVVLASVLFVTWAHWLYRSLKLILLRFLHHPHSCHLHCCSFLIVWARRSIALPRANQPLIDLLVSFEDTLIVRATVISTQCALLSNHKVDLCHYGSVPPRVLPCRRRWLRLQLRWRWPVHLRGIARIVGILSWSLTPSSLLELNLDCRILLRDWQATRASLEGELEDSLGLLLLLVLCLLLATGAISSRIRVIVGWRAIKVLTIDVVRVSSVLLQKVIFFNHLNVSWLWSIKNRWWRVVS